MTAKIETATVKQNPSRWQRLLAWVTAFEQAMDYDPQDHANASIKYLKDEVKQLNARLDAAEGRNQRAA